MILSQDNGYMYTGSPAPRENRDAEKILAEPLQARHREILGPHSCLPAVHAAIQGGKLLCLLARGFAVFPAPSQPQ